MATDPQPAPTVTELLLARADDQRVGLRFADLHWSWSEHVHQCGTHATTLRALLPAHAPPHVGVLADNLPSFSFLLGAAAFSGSVLVGLNTTRRGEALARDIRLADCQLVLTEHRYAHLLEGLDLGDASGNVFELDGQGWSDALTSASGQQVDPVIASPEDLLMLIFTSGTSGEPKAVRCTHGKIAFPGRMLAERFGLCSDDTVYVAMPMFHSNAIMAGWSVGLAAGAAIALRRKFSASGFLPDVRRFGATYANYVGKPLSYVLATPQRADDAENPLRFVYGNEGAQADLAPFGKRFGCHVVDAFGSTEGGIGFSRTPDTPAEAIGRPGEDVTVLHPETRQPCPPAQFDAHGQLSNPEQAIGELVNTSGPGAFAGYYAAPAADAERLRDGMYFTGDLAYLDADGFCYFAGRLGDWLRVDGENLGTAPIERILLRHPDVADAAVYAVDDDHVGDQVMAALVPRTGGRLDPIGFADFLAAQRDLSPKQVPRYVRLIDELPRTPTYKVIKRELAARRCDPPGQVWWRADDGAFQTFQP